MAFPGGALLPAQGDLLTIRPGGAPSTVPVEHETTVLKFLQSHAEDLAKCLPAGSMIESLLSLEVITQKESEDLSRRRDFDRATDEELAEEVISLVQSGTKTAQQRVDFLRVIEETRASGISKTILRGIWVLLQSQGGHGYDAVSALYSNSTKLKVGTRVYQQAPEIEPEAGDTSVDYARPAGKKYSQDTAVDSEHNSLTLLSKSQPLLSKYLKSLFVWS